ncbi:MAG: hypothetical protein KDD02_02470 [Phaeodactylibacter sp.]|nr:hypothetical protein [Phaeodactylibacter sp.]MCB9302791.1 hypothetical protein [Lewinellaceae bacterium]
MFPVKWLIIGENRAWRWALGAAFMLLVLAIGYWPHQGDFAVLMALYVPAFLLYMLLYRQAHGRGNLLFFLLLGALIRLLLLPAMPLLSDDVYRFIWDGRLINSGINPFAHTPAFYLEAANTVSGLNPDLYNKLNSPEYFTVYPPLAQATFALACWIFPKSIWGAAIVMKLVLLIFEWGTLALLPCLLRRMGLPEKGALLYALNPLILIEVMGNLHFEGAMIFFLLLGLWLLSGGRWQVSAVAMALAVASKLLPLLFFPFFIRRLGWRKSIAYFSIAGIVLLVLFAPLLGEAFLAGFGSSLQLYFQQFEFNASIYYLLRWLGYRISGYNLIAYIGPLLALVTLGSIVYLAFKDMQKDWQSLPGRMLLAICLYLALSPTVHPWYASLPVALATMSRFRFPILWSGLIWLTYINYSYPEYYENLWVVSLEYLAIYGLAIWEVRNGRNWIAN